MQLVSTNGITTRKDGLPYDITKIDGKWVLRATGNPAKPVVITTANSYTEALFMLIAQAPEAK